MTVEAQHIAQLNIGRVRHPLDDPRMADFMDNLVRINALAERSPGFVWRYSDESGNATSTRPYPDDSRMMVNMSVWESVAALEKFVWQTVHTRFYGRKHEWFEKLDGPYFVLWRVPAEDWEAELANGGMTLPLDWDATLARWDRGRVTGAAAGSPT